MTDNDWRNARIEEAAKAIWSATYLLTWDEALDSERDACLEEARAAFAVFEKAHTPTDDEREAAVTSAYGVITSHYWSTNSQPGVCDGCGEDVDAQPGGTMAEHRAQKLFEAGLLRRPEVPEPSAEDAVVTLTTEAVEANREYIERTQGEPSDAQVKAFTDTEWEHRFMAFHGGWSCKCGWDIPGPKLTTDEAAKRHRDHQARVALRAAFSLREGEAQ